MKKRHIALQEDLLRKPVDGVVGIDEAGKGDYFGPLVIAACFADDSIDSSFKSIGLRESKSVSDRRVYELESRIKKIAPYEVVAIGPEKYNELHSKMHNLNRLLAWGHARALENILERVNPEEVVADQFGNERFVINALMKKGREVKLTQRTRAESLPAVAAASILARAEFLRRLDALSKKHSSQFPKGAGPQVDLAAKAFVEANGLEELHKIVKIHFKNTKRVIG